MIKSFRERALKRLWERDDDSRINANMRKRVRLLLNVLDVSNRPEDMDQPGFGYHPLQGEPNRYAVRVTANWRLTFEWSENDGAAFGVDLEDYH